MSFSIEVLPDSEMRRLKRTSYNRLVDISDWRPGGLLVKFMQAMGEGPYVHRKSWEYGMCVMGLFGLGAINPFARGLAVAAGYERPFYYLTHHVEHVTATDLYDNPDHEGKPEILANPRAFAPFDYPEHRLSVMRMDATKLEFPTNSFDFVFCLSSIEHYGSRELSRKGMQEMWRVVKPGGLICVATELILNGAVHNEYFTPQEFEEVILRSTPLELVGGPIDARISKSLVEHPLSIGIDDLGVSPHIVLRQGQVVFTSLIVFLRKPLL